MSKPQEAGQELENIVENVYSILLHNEHLKNSKIEKNHIENGRSGAKHEFDIFYEVDIAGVTHKVAIECKNHNRKITKGTFGEFKQKLDDCNNIRGFMISAKGYQEGAKLEGKYYGIELITTEDLPYMYSLSLTYVKWLLPDENTYGDPFWTIMQITEDRKNTGIFYSPTGVIPLFLSKKSAERALKITEVHGFAVFGVTREHLIGICHMAEEYNWPFAIAAKLDLSQTAGSICLNIHMMRY
ncbi:MAG: restriction endonuclease [Methanosarcina sp.]